jgi:hypothetical protein
MHDSLARFFRLTPADLAYVKFTLEAYEGLVVMHTLDGTQGLIEIIYPCDLASTVDDLLASLGRELDLLEIPRPTDRPLLSPTPRTIGDLDA